MSPLGPDICANVVEATAREWLETNGKGGFASGTVGGIHTRRYHGLLTAALGDPPGRYLLLSKLEETVIYRGRRFELSANRYPGVIHPRGFQYLRRFRLDPFPVFTFEVNGLEIEKSVFMVNGEDTVVVRYEFGPADAELEIRPLVAFRDYHSTTHENRSLNGEVNCSPGVASLQPYHSLPRLYLAHDAEAVDTDGAWYRNFEYDLEHERGLDYREDLYQAFTLRFRMAARESASVVAGLTPRKASDAPDLREGEIRRRRRVVAPWACRDRFVRSLAAAADQFMVEWHGRRSIIAGYPWFADWGRDSMVSLTGLALVTDRAEDAREILLTYASKRDRGLIPNRFAEPDDRPEYNTADATLWFFEAVRKLLQYTGDYEFVRNSLYAAMTDMLDWHLRGTHFGIRADGDGLLACGEPGVQLTWMDAKTGGHVVTARQGKPVEIQALWYAALRFMESLAARFDDTATAHQASEVAEKAAYNFNRLFWNEEAGCLYDVVDEGTPDPAIRPNQVLVVAMPRVMISRERAIRVLDVVRRWLLTPYGLRTLSSDDPRYRGRYQGSLAERDAAYHQGTVWPWLLGPFIAGWCNVYGRTDAVLAQVREWLSGLESHLGEACLGQVSEIFDGDPPHSPRGAVAQAWSVAELLRASAEAFSHDSNG